MKWGGVGVGGLFTISSIIWSHVLASPSKLLAKNVITAKRMVNQKYENDTKPGKEKLINNIIFVATEFRCLKRISSSEA